jgi:serine protease inhibitor
LVLQVVAVISPDLTYKDLNCTQAVLDDNTGNAVVSPVSVSTLLALVQQGAGGNTLNQLTDGLYLDKEQSRQGYSQLTRNLKVIRSGEEIEK